MTHRDTRLWQVHDKLLHSPGCFVPLVGDHFQESSDVGCLGRSLGTCLPHVKPCCVLGASLMSPALQLHIPAARSLCHSAPWACPGPHMMKTSSWMAQRPPVGLQTAIPDNEPQPPRPISPGIPNGSNVRKCLLISNKIMQAHIFKNSTV